MPDYYGLADFEISAKAVGLSHKAPEKRYPDFPPGLVASLKSNNPETFRRKQRDGSTYETLAVWMPRDRFASVEVGANRGSVLWKSLPGTLHGGRYTITPPETEPKKSTAESSGRRGSQHGGSRNAGNSDGTKDTTEGRLRGRQQTSQSDATVGSQFSDVPFYAPPTLSVSPPPSRQANNRGSGPFGN